MYLPLSNKSRVNRNGKGSRRKAAAKAKNRRRVNGMAGRKLARRIGRA